MDGTDKTECENCQKSIRECLCPPSACIACTRLFKPELMKVHETMCGNLQETCVFCDRKYFVRDRPVHRRRCRAYQRDCLERLFYSKAIEHWTPAEHQSRFYFDADLLFEYVTSLIRAMDVAALELKRRRQALLYLRRKGKKNRLPDFSASFGGSAFPPINISDFPPLLPVPLPRPFTLPTSSQVDSSAMADCAGATCTAVVPYIPMTRLLQTSPSAPLPPPPRSVSASSPSARQTQRMCFSDVIVGARDAALTSHTSEVQK